jgi:hypothetical protein
MQTEYKGLTNCCTKGVCKGSIWESGNSRGGLSGIGVYLLLVLDKVEYRRTSISGTTFSGRKCLSGTSFHAI